MYITEDNALGIINIAVTSVSALLYLYFSIRSNNKIEKLKSQLDIQSNKSKVLFEEEKNSILNFYSVYKLWHEDNKDIATYDFPQINRIKNLGTILPNGYSKVYHETSKLQLFIDNKELLDITFELVKHTKELHEINLDCLDEVYHLLEDYQTIVANPQYNSADNYSIEKELNKQYKKYHVKFNPKHNEVIALEKIFLDLAKKYIRSDGK